MKKMSKGSKQERLKLKVEKKKSGKKKVSISEKKRETQVN